ncbi:MAG: hypothetical protein B6D64_04135 [Bacteroidetes bacterium 4484_276]|nr:MAG: hypothetical protein B6D64_04135 [Bacteroidetes bacterium 4484_276]OYT13765.1 MAG: PIN domain nuclease [Bacteroidetes bacterium 4572_114]
MGLIDKLHGAKIFLDTAPIIYYIEGNVKYQDFLSNLFKLNVREEVDFVTSSITFMEIMVLPFRLGQFELIKQYETILSESETIIILDLDLKIAKAAAEIRAKYNIKTPDSIQLATAINQSCNFFLTNDKKLKISGITTLYLDEIVKIQTW